MASGPPNQRTIPLLLLAIAGLFFTLVWAYTTHYTQPDLFVWWRSSQIWLSGIDPYSREADTLLSGALANVRSGFAYPFPVIILSVPLALLPLPWAAASWSLISMAVLMALPLASKQRITGATIALPLLYFPVYASLEEAQWAPILLLFALVSLLLFHTGRVGLAGLMMPLVVLKPQVGMALFVGLVAHALLARAGRRWWFGLALGVLIWWGGSLLIAPSWPWGWLRQLGKYTAEDQNVVDAFSLAGGLLFCGFFALAWRSWRAGDPYGLLAAVVAAVLLVLPTRSFYNHVLLLLPLAIIAPKHPRVALAAAGLSWAILAVALLGGDGTLERVLALYMPLAGALFVYQNQQGRRLDQIE